MPDTEPYGTLFDALPIGAYRSRPDGTLMRANLALARLNGFATLEELAPAVHDIGLEWYVDPGRRWVFRDTLERDGQVRGFVSEVYRYATRERIWVSENAHVVRNEQGQVRYYEGTVEDITRQVKAQRALSRNEQQLRQIADHFPGMVYRVHNPVPGGPAARYSYVSPGVRDLYGVSPDAVHADPGLLPRFRHPDDTARVQAAVVHSQQTGEPLTVAFRIVVGGETKWVQMSSSPAAQEDGLIVRVGVVIDITAQRQAEALRAERDQAALERRQMTQFLSRVSHELRTPLNAILGFAQLIDMEADTPDTQRRWTHALLQSGRHLLDLVNDVLDLSGAQSGQMAVDLQAVDVAAVLDEAWSMVRADALARHIAFGGMPVQPGTLAVQADRRRLLQVLANLMSNAVKYNRPGGPLGLAAWREGTQVCMAVSDGGEGMSAEQLARLFIPFDRLGAQHGTVPGTGLGLALSRQLAQAMGGTLDARSQPGQGCSFMLRLPVAGAAPPAAGG